MIETYRRLQRRRLTGEIDGFTLIELLIVIVVLGILAAIVVFALGGVTGKSAAAACQSDAKTVGVGVSALLAENPQYQTSGITTPEFQTIMTYAANATTTTIANGAVVTGYPFVQTWPSSSSYGVFVGDGTTSDAPSGVAVESGLPTGTAVGDVTAATSTAYGDVYVYGLRGTFAKKAFDATLNPIEACNWAVLGHS